MSLFIKLKNKRYIVALMVFAILFSMLLINKNSIGINHKTAPIAKNGVLDLRNWDFEKDGIVPLNGQWDFYYNYMLSPENFMYGNIPQRTGYISIPGNYNNFILNGKKINGQGIATYRLKILTSSRDDYFSIKTQFLLSAHKLWAEGEIVSQNGIVGRTEKEMKPQLMPQTGNFYSESGEFTLLLQVSNYQSRTSQVDEILLGNKTALADYTNRKLGFDFFLIGITLIIALYHFVLFCKRRNDKAPLYFAIICSIISFRTALIGERIFVRNFPDFNYSIYMMFCYITFFIYIPFLVLFVDSFYSAKISMKIKKISIICGAIYMTLVILLPIKMYDYLIFPFELVAVFLITYLCCKLIKKNSQENYKFSLVIFSLIVVLTTRINDILYEYSIIQTESLIAVGLLIFIIVQSVSLADQFSKAMLDIETLSEKLKIADKIKDDFLRTISYELKTPLIGIIEFTEGLVDDASNFELKGQQDKIQTIHLSANRLANLVNDLSDFIKLKNGEIILEKSVIDIRQIIKMVIRSYEQYLDDKLLILKNDLPDDLPLVYADKNRIQQVFYNIIGNSMKFTFSGNIKVNAEVIGQNIKFTITDTGIGIPANKLMAMLEPFAKNDAIISDISEGTVLGIYMAKKIIEHHGGKLVATSIIGKGSNFSFCLPIYSSKKEYVMFNENNYLKSEEKKTKVKEEAIYVEGKHKILIADDSAINIKILQNILSNENYFVYTAFSGTDALNILNENKNIELVILDMMMPDMLGNEICEIIRKNYSIFQLPIIMMTASNKQEFMTIAFNSGVNDFLTKPFDKNELLVRVKTLITLKESVENAIVLKNAVEKTNEQMQMKNKELTEMIEYDRFKTDFFVNISHELRTPLNVISSTIQLLKSFNKDKLISEENINHYLNSMNQNCLRLIRLTNNLIDTIRMDGDFLTLNLQNDNIVYTIEEITLSVANYVKHKGITLIFDTDIEEQIMAYDAEKIERVILNLLSNAIKFTKDNGNIWVDVFHIDDRVIITVKDNGIGIPKENLEHIFRRFTQIDRSLSRNSEGSGIGLALVKSLVELHDGTIKVESEINKGSKFIIELPIKLVENHAVSKLNLMNDASEAINKEKVDIEFSDIYL